MIFWRGSETPVRMVVLGTGAGCWQGKSIGSTPETQGADPLKKSVLRLPEGSRNSRTGYEASRGGRQWVSLVNQARARVMQSQASMGRNAVW